MSKKTISLDAVAGHGFLTDPAINHVRTRPGYVKLSSELVWRKDSGEIVVVPAGYEYNGASIPRIAWTLIDHPLADWLIRGAGVHDFRCETRTISSHDAHKEFFECISFDARTWSQRKWKRFACYSAVRVFGPRW